MTVSVSFALTGPLSSFAEQLRSMANSLEANQIQATSIVQEAVAPAPTPTTVQEAPKTKAPPAKKAAPVKKAVPVIEDADPFEMTAEESEEVIEVPLTLNEIKEAFLAFASIDKLKALTLLSELGYKKLADIEEADFSKVMNAIAKAQK